MRMINFFLVFLLSLSLHAQEKNKSVHLFAHSLFGKDAKNVIGLGIKYLAGSNGKDFLSLSGSFNLFPLESDVASDGGNKRTLPLLAGYHRRFERFYAEPQVGYGVYAARIIIQDFALPSQGAFFWGMETGYMFRRLSIQVKYSSAHTKKNEWLGKSFSYVAAGIAYDISPNKSSQRD